MPKSISVITWRITVNAPGHDSKDEGDVRVTSSRRGITMPIKRRHQPLMSPISSAVEVRLEGCRREKPLPHSSEVVMAGRGAWRTLLLLLLLLLLRRGERVRAQGIHCQDHDRTCTISSHLSVWGDRQECAFANVVRPTTEQELVQAVANAVRHNRKVKVTRGFPHSTPKLTCPGSSTGTVISTERYDASIVIDKDVRTATVGAGAKLHDLLEALADQGLALPSVPVWSFLSVVGLLSTGAHGSSMWEESPPLHDRIVSLRLVVPASAAEGYAKVLEIGVGSDEELLAAARVSLGVLGAISQVTVRADAIFKRNLSFEKASDSDLAERVLAHSQKREFGEIFWFPSQRQAIFQHSSRVEASVPGDDSYAMAALLPLPLEPVVAARELEEAAEATRDRTKLCDLAPTLISASWNTDPDAPPLVGLSHRMQTSQACTVREPGDGTYCLFEEPRMHWHETSFTVNASRIGDYVRDIAALRDKRPDSLCGLAFAYGLWFRFVPGPSRALLGEAWDVVDVNALYFRSAPAQAEEPRLDQDVYDEMEQLAMLKYRGTPHWGKSNRHVSFLGVKEKLGGRVERFVEVMKRLDPQGIFSSPWTDAVLGLGGTELNDLRPLCGLEGMCICQTDEHCRPSAGYFCRPGLVFPEARVCRFEASEASRSLKDEL